MNRKEAWSFDRIISGVRLCWELEKPEGHKGPTKAPVTCLSPFTLLTSVHWGKPLHVFGDFRTLGETSTHPPVSLPQLCELNLTLLTSIHWGKPRHVFRLTI